MRDLKGNFIKNYKLDRKTKIRLPKNIKERRKFLKKVDYKNPIIQKFVKEQFQKPGIKDLIQECRKLINKYNKEYQRGYYPKHKDYYKKYYKNKYNIDKNFNISERLRKLILIALKNYSKTGKIMSSKQYGIDYKAIIKHLEPFPEDLSNHHIHHIVPLKLFNFNDLEQIKLAFAPENHMWMTKEEHYDTFSFNYPKKEEMFIYQKLFK